MADFVKQFEEMLKQAVKDTGKELAVTPAVMAQLMVTSNARLQEASGTAGFQEALGRELKALAIRGGIVAVDKADVIDARWWGILWGSLSIAAAAL